MSATLFYTEKTELKRETKGKKVVG